MIKTARRIRMILPPTSSTNNASKSITGILGRFRAKICEGFAET
jgi:hypothetical protein